MRQLEGVHGDPGAGRLRRARLGGQDRGGAVRPRAAGAVFRHLLRHADGGDRDGASPRQAGRRRLDRVRPVRPSGDRADDRMDARQHAGACAKPAATSAARCASAPTRRCSTRKAASPRSTAGRRSASATATATRSTSPIKRHARSRRPAFFRHVAGWSAARDRRDPGASLVHRRAVPPRAEIAPVRTAPAVHLVRQGGGRPVAAGVTFRQAPHPGPLPAMRGEGGTRGAAVGGSGAAYAGCWS